MKPKTSTISTVGGGTVTCLPDRGWLAGVADICNSELAKGIAFALIILSTLLGIGGCTYLKKKGDALVKEAIENKAIPQPTKE